MERLPTDVLAIINDLLPKWADTIALGWTSRAMRRNVRLIIRDDPNACGIAILLHSGMHIPHWFDPLCATEILVHIGQWHRIWFIAEYDRKCPYMGEIVKRADIVRKYMPTYSILELLELGAPLETLQLIAVDKPDTDWAAIYNRANTRNKIEIANWVFKIM